MNILFINGSPNSNGNTAALAKELLQGKEYETLNLTDYKIGSYGQKLEGDGLGQVIAKMEQAEVIVIGSPLYWHNIWAQCEICWIASTVWCKTAHCRAEHFISSFRALRRKNGCWKPENIR